MSARGGGPSLSSVLLGLLPAVLLFSLFTAVGLLHVTARVMVVDSAYRLSRLEQEGRRLTLDNDKLKLELATLKSPARLEKLAREQLGMAPPTAAAVLSPSRAHARAPAVASRRPERSAP